MQCVSEISQLTIFQGIGVYSIDTNFIRENAAKVLEATDVQYLQRAQLRGSLFQEDCNSGAVSSVFTEFYVDHREPLEALDEFKAKSGGNGA